MMQVRILKARDPFLQAHKKEVDKSKPPRVSADTLQERPALPARGPCPGATSPFSTSAEDQQDAMMALEREHEEDPMLELQQQRLELLPMATAEGPGESPGREKDAPRSFAAAAHAASGITSLLSSV